jgi:plastocyanin
MPKPSRIAVATAAILTAFSAGNHWRPAMPHAHAVGTMPMMHDHANARGTIPIVAADPNQVVIDDFAFGPATLIVSPGTEVVWINADDEPHTVTATGDKPLFKSPPLDTKDKFSFVFKDPGTYAYFCTLHPRMQGTVIVR